MVEGSREGWVVDCGWCRLYIEDERMGVVKMIGRGW